MLFDSKNFNGEVFDALVKNTPNLRLNELLKCKAIVEKPEYAAQLPDQLGGHFITSVIKARIGGTALNYDGKTDITATSRGNYTMGRIVVGRANGWTEKDFTADITGDDYMPAAEEVGEYWDDVDQDTLLATLKGIFSMSSGEGAEFVKKHTHNIAVNLTGNKFDATTLNTGMQKALGDKKAKFALAIVHSAVATNLENLRLVEYLKYTDENGIERDLGIATVNGRILLIDDTMPCVEGYFDAIVDTEGALKIVADSASPADGEIKLADAKAAYLGEKNLAADMYVVLDHEYTTYVLGEGAIEYTNCGVKTPSEIERAALKNGGESTLVSRQRKVFAPYGISWKTNSIISPTDAQLENGTNWEIANSNEGTKKYYPIKAIAIARIKSRG